MDKLRVSIVLACFLFYLGFSLSQAATKVTTDGIKFPDGTTQTTAASGGGTASFPRPAYDSGWHTLEYGYSNEVTLNHNLGGNPDNYFVDLSWRYLDTYDEVHTFWSRSNSGLGGYDYYDPEIFGDHEARGIWYTRLTETIIIVKGGTEWDGGSTKHFRIRIWRY